MHIERITVIYKEDKANKLCIYMYILYTNQQEVCLHYLFTI